MNLTPATTALALLLAAPAIDVRGLELRLEATKKQILVGERLKLLLTYRARSPIALALHDDAVYIDAGSGYRLFWDIEEKRGGTLFEVTPHPAGWQFAEILQVGLSQNDKKSDAYFQETGMRLRPAPIEFAFPSPGRYRIKVVYKTLESNVVEIEARAPAGSDLELFTRYLQPKPHLMTFQGLLEDLGVEGAHKLLQSYKGSVYLSQLQLRMWERDFGFALKSFNDKHGEGAARVGGLQGEPGDVLREMEESDWQGGSFDDDRLAQLAEKRRFLGDQDGAVRTYKELLARHPSSPRAADAKQLLEVLERRDEGPRDNNP